MNLSLTTDDLLQADRRTVKRSLMSWGTGRNHTGEPVRPGRSAIVVLENADALPDVLAAGLVDADSTVFVGGTDDQGPLSREPGRPRVVGYQGSAAEPGEELSIGDDFFLQIQDYATSEYMSLLGPTLIRICGPQDFAAFLADADRARDTGSFAEFATNPAVQFADQSAYGATLLDGARTVTAQNCGCGSTVRARCRRRPTGRSSDRSTTDSPRFTAGGRTSMPAAGFPVR